MLLQVKCIEFSSRNRGSFH